MEFAEVNAAFKRLGIAQEISESHGLLCGLWCASGGVSLDVWLRLMRNEDLPAPSAKENGDDGKDEEAGGNRVPAAAAAAGEDEKPAAKPDEEVLQRLYRETVDQLENPAFGLRLLLPDDEQPLGLRTEALADWCKGFLFGLGVGGVENYRQTPAAVQEIVKDFTEITRACHEENEDSELDEVSFMEVMEYVRVGAMLVYEELQAKRREQMISGDRVLH